MNIKFKNLNKTIVKCKKCPRLNNFIKKISSEKRKQNINEEYWGKPVTGLPQYFSFIFCFLFSAEIFFMKLFNLEHFLHLIIVLFSFLNLIFINQIYKILKLLKLLTLSIKINYYVFKKSNETSPKASLC